MVVSQGMKGRLQVAPLEVVVWGTWSQANQKRDVLCDGLGELTSLSLLGATLEAGGKNWGGQELLMKSCPSGATCFPACGLASWTGRCRSWVGVLCL